eukprot:1014887-Prymnesium_polylepis.1
MHFDFVPVWRAPTLRPACSVSHAVAGSALRLCVLSFCTTPLHSLRGMFGAATSSTSSATSSVMLASISGYKRTHCHWLSPPQLSPLSLYLLPPRPGPLSQGGYTGYSG